MRGRRGKGGCFARLFLLALVLLIAAVGGAAYLLSQPYQGFGKEVFLDFAKGTSTEEMASQLTSGGVIRSEWLFLAARALQPKARLQAGEYRFSSPASIWTVFERIVHGDVFYYEVTIPEGSNIFDIANDVDRLGFIKGADFLKVARDPALIEDLAPGAPSLEGYLFPSTYRLTRRTTALQVCRMMTELFRKRWDEVRGEGQGSDVNRTVTLASLIEKETGIPSDRPAVASVYANRLRLRMPLDCDPTTIYAALLEGRYHGVIHRSDLGSDSPYNTYRHAGLPPGPVANPGMASLRAALKPAETDFLYFVVRPGSSGGSNFSRTLAEHNQHVREYRAGRK